MGKRGPKPLEYTEVLRTSVPREVNEALEVLVRVGGISRAHLVRVAITDLLTHAGVLFPEVAEALHPTAPAGRSRIDKEKKR